MQMRILTFGDGVKVAHRLDQYAHRGQNTLPAMQEIALEMLRIEKIVFSSGGRRGGGQWRRLKPDTLRKKGVTKILRTEGANPGYSKPGHDALYKSVTSVGAPGQILNVTRRGVELGTNVPGAKEMQLGAPAKNIPPRPFLRFLPSDTRRFQDILLRHLMGVR